MGISDILTFLENQGETTGTSNTSVTFTFSLDYVYVVLHGDIIYGIYLDQDHAIEVSKRVKGRVELHELK